MPVSILLSTKEGVILWRVTGTGIASFQKGNRTWTCGGCIQQGHEQWCKTQPANYPAPAI